jgi:CubicO group peptidase (beta-lactamase class C family)
MSAQNITRERLDSLFDALAAGNKAMGSICITQNGKQIYNRSIGYSLIDTQTKIPADHKTKYRIASITKMFTAAIMFQLIQEGKIDFETTLDEYYKDLPGAKNITIGMMMSHRSGLHNIFDEPDFTSWKTIQRSEEEVVAMIGKNPLEFTPDSKASYSNSNYLLLGYIIERICKKPFSEVVHDRIISKIGLKHTYYGGKTDMSKGECYSYVYDNSGWVKQPEADMSILGAAGALVSTPADMNKFIEALYAHRLFKVKYLAKMLEIKDGFGMGMMPFTYGSRTAYGHPGGIDGFNSVLEYFPEEDLIICYCSNGQFYNMSDIINPALSIILDNSLGN